MSSSGTREAAGWRGRRPGAGWTVCAGRGGGRRVCHGAPATSAPVDHASRTGRGRTARRPRGRLVGRPGRAARWPGGGPGVGSWGIPSPAAASATRRRHVGPAEGAHLAPPVFRSAAEVWQALRDRDIRGQVAAPARFSGPTAGEKCDDWRGATPASGRGRVPNRLSSGHRTLVGLESTPLADGPPITSPDEVSRDSLCPFRRIAIPCRLSPSRVCS